MVRENTEGEYSSVGGTMFEGTDREVVIQETVMTRHGVDRVLKYAFDLAATRPRKKLTSATKSNGIAITMPWWDKRVAAMGQHYPDVNVDQFHIDIIDKVDCIADASEAQPAPRTDEVRYHFYR